MKRVVVKLSGSLFSKGIEDLTEFATLFQTLLRKDIQAIVAAWQAGAISRVQELGPDGELLWNMSLRQGENSFQGDRAQRLQSVVVDTPGDRDGDWDLDLLDLAGLQAGYASSELGFPERLSDLDGDGHLGAGDLEALVNWMTGPVE